MIDQHAYGERSPQQPTSCIYPGASKQRLGGAAACAVKRIHLDNRMAKCAAKTGAKLLEGFEVGTDVTFDKDTGLWTVKSTKVLGEKQCW